jgi:hypothetical protein
MQGTYKKKLRKLFDSHRASSTFLAGACFLFAIVLGAWLFLAFTVLYATAAFWTPVDRLNVYRKLYWIIRKDPRRLSVGRGTMRETNYPWRQGSGVYVTVWHRCFHLGLCAPFEFETEEDGILSAVQGRYLDATPVEIGEWNAVQKDEA